MSKECPALPANRKTARTIVTFATVSANPDTGNARATQEKKESS